MLTWCQTTHSARRSSGYAPNAASTARRPRRTFLTPTLFRTAIPLPAEVPIGAYGVEIKLFSAGHLLTQTDTSFEIVKVGFEQFVATAARADGFIYGLVTAFMARMTGWMASIVFRKD